MAKAKMVTASGIKGLSPSDILKKPYHRVVVPEEDGSFSAEISEFPGCITTADTGATALALLEEVAESWIEAALAMGQKIPEPIEELEYSGKTVLRLPKSLHRQAAILAKRDGVSLNHFISSAVAMSVGAASSSAKSVPAIVYNVASEFTQFNSVTLAALSGVSYQPVSQFSGSWQRGMMLDTYSSKESQNG